VFFFLLLRVSQCLTEDLMPDTWKSMSI
jgi:hypothetical protein